MAKKSALEQYEAKLAEAEKYAGDAAKEMREHAAALVDELKEVEADYSTLTGKDLPELAKLGGSGRKGSKTSSKAGTSGKRTRKKLSGKYQGMTIPDAVEAAIGNSKSGLGPQEIADKIGGNKQSVAVAVAKMVKEKRLKRVERGLYTKA